MVGPKTNNVSAGVPLIYGLLPGHTINTMRGTPIQKRDMRQLPTPGARSSGGGGGKDESVIDKSLTSGIITQVF